MGWSSTYDKIAYHHRAIPHRVIFKELFALVGGHLKGRRAGTGAGRPSRQHGLGREGPTGGESTHRNRKDPEDDGKDDTTHPVGQ